MIEEIAHLGLLDDDEIDLVPAALELAALDHLALDIDPAFDLLDEMASALEVYAGEADDPRYRAEALCELVAGEYGFDGDRLSYDDPANADMIAVMERRRGLPVSLSILYADLARRQDWTCQVLGTPGHVLVRMGDRLEDLLLDPFNGGAVIDEAGVGRMLSGLAGRPVVPRPEHFTPMSNREVLVRLLQNPASRAEAAGDQVRAMVLYERMTVVAPGNAQGWWNHARLSLAAGSVSDARDSLEAMLEVTRDPTQRRRIVSMIANLQQG